jgi:hypothetical protein
MRAPYTLTQRASGNTGLLPFLPITLISGDKKVETIGLLDSGSTINVLPYALGISLGLEWEKQKASVPLTGSLAKVESVGTVIFGQVGDFQQRRLVFAWAKSDQMPLILGQTNFFQEFNVCFFRSELVFEVKQK